MPLILHADPALIVIDKPAGLLSQPGKGPDKTDSVITRLMTRFNDAIIVHRLDQPTSGLMLVARGAEMSRALGRAFRERRVEKRYQAVVDGLMESESGTIDLPLIADWPNRPRQRIDFEHGKPSLTHYRVVERNQAGSWTRVDLEPITGRSHQLRMHMMALGHTILGDMLYASPEVLSRAPRLQLHARRLAFTHPLSGLWMTFESVVPF